MDDFILILILALILGGAVLYIRKAKKKGVKCIGCPDSSACQGNCPGCQKNKANF